ncbi:MAG: two-component system NarL family sensor kinase [Paraglaciecola sp.]|jgi:two-component system NarL family sensor kinase
MKQIWWCFLFFGIVEIPIAMSQNPFLDSLKMVVDTMPNSKEKVTHLITISVQTYAGEQATKYGWEAIREAKTFGDRLLLADAYFNMASLYNVSEKVDSFNLFAEKAAQYYEALNDGWGLASIHQARGNLLGKFKQHEAADENFQKAMEYAIQAKHDRIKIEILNDWGVYLRTIKNYQESIGKLKKGLTIFATTGQTNLATLSRLEFNLGRSLQDNQQFSEALDYQTKAYQKRIKLNIQGGIAESQIQLLRLNLDIQKANKDTSDFQKTINILGYSNAQSILDSLAISTAKTNHAGLTEMFYKISHRYHEERGNYQQALKFFKAGKQLEDSLLLSKKNLAALADLDLKYNNEVLQNEVLRTQIAESKSKNERNILLLLLFAALSAGILGILYFRQRLEARNIALQLEAQKVKELERQQQLVAMNAMLEGQEKERSRIAKDLHDGLGNMLTSIKYQIAGLPLGLDNNFKKVQGKAENMIDDACSEVRKIAHNMMPIALEKLGLTRALEDLCEKHQAHQSYEVIFQIFGREARFKTNVETMLYRIAQEIFNNINKHAEASEVVVQMTYSEDWLNLTFEDDGKGFDKQEIMKNGGLGLHSIQSRTDYLSGECLIDARLDKGTNISINIPINVTNMKA